MIYRKLNSLVRDITGKVTAALNAPTPADKVEQLLAARDESRERMLQLERRQSDVGVAGFLGFFPGGGLMLAGATGFMAAPSLAAVSAVLLAAPLFVAGLALTTVSLGAMFVMGAKVERLRSYRDTIEKQINREAQTIALAHPKEVDKSQRFLHSLYTVFNCAAAPGDTSYAAMEARVSKKAAAPVPAIAAPAAQ